MSDDLPKDKDYLNMEELTTALEKLRSEKNEDAVVSALSTIQDILEEHYENVFIVDEEKGKELILTLLKDGLVEILTPFLFKKSLSTKGIALVMEVIACLAKTDAGREKFTSEDIISVILDFFNEQDIDLLHGAFRAISNICYDNGKAKVYIFQKKWVVVLIEYLKKNVEDGTLPEKLQAVSAGCLLNLTDLHAGIQEQALDAGLVDLVLQYVDKYSSDSQTMTYCLIIFTCLILRNNSVCTDVLDDRVLTSLLKLCDSSLNDCALDSLIELLGYLTSNDLDKLRLAKLGYCDKLVDIIKMRSECRNSNPDSAGVIKDAASIVATIISGDESAEYLYQDGKSRIYKECMSWIDSDNEVLHTPGALAAGNYARSDKHCIQMVDDGIPLRLLNLLKKHATIEGDITVQHAVLSTFKNLAIPVVNKAHFVEIGAVDVLISMVDVEHVESYPVVSKLIAAIRMIAMPQGEVIHSMGEDKAFIERLIHWTNINDYSPVKSEATRLLAKILENSKNIEVHKNFISWGALVPITSMLQSEHEIMKIEALNAMKTCASNNSDYIEENMDANVLEKTIIDNLKGSPALVEATLLFLEDLLKSEKIKNALHTSSLQAELKAITEQNASNESHLKAKEILLKFK